MTNHKAHAVILNPNSKGGRGVWAWKEFLRTSEAKEAGLESAVTFEGASGSSHSFAGGCFHAISGAPLQAPFLDSALTNWVTCRIREGCRNFVAAGGDGTVNKVINILMRMHTSVPESRECKLGAVALGSSNDFHKPFPPQRRGSTPYSRLDFKSAFPHDVGQASFTENPERKTQYFVINSSIGITAQANLYFNQAGGGFHALKKACPALAIVYAAVREWLFYQSFAIEWKISSPQKAKLLNLGVTKNPHFAGSFRYDALQKVDDGELMVHLYQELDRRQGKRGILKALWALSQGRFSGIAGATSHRATEITVQSERNFALETDGEVFQTRRVAFKILPREVLVCPAYLSRSSL